MPDFVGVRSVTGIDVWMKLDFNPGFCRKCAVAPVSATRGLRGNLLWAGTIMFCGNLFVSLLIVFPVSHFLVGLLRNLICPS